MALFTALKANYANRYAHQMGEVLCYTVPVAPWVTNRVNLEHH